MLFLIFLNLYLLIGDDKKSIKVFYKKNILNHFTLPELVLLALALAALIFINHFF